MSKELVTEMSTNVNVGMDEVVSVFVSRYETSLFDMKDELSDKIKVVKQELEDLDENLKGTVDKSKYEMTNSVLGISSKVENVGVTWTEKKQVIVVDVKVKDEENTGYSSYMTKDIEIEISDKFVKQHNELESQLENLKTELMDVMGKIKGVSRKERQIRGKISEMKLKESGYDGLLDNPEMLKLVQL